MRRLEEPGKAEERARELAEALLREFNESAEVKGREGESNEKNESEGSDGLAMAAPDTSILERREELFLKLAGKCQSAVSSLGF